jgi:hypothetical protein
MDTMQPTISEVASGSHPMAPFQNAAKIEGRAGHKNGKHQHEERHQTGYAKYQT